MEPIVAKGKVILCVEGRSDSKCFLRRDQEAVDPIDRVQINKEFIYCGAVFEYSSYQLVVT